MYEITFTESFRDGLKRLPKESHSIIDRQLRLIATDPFAKNPQAKRMKNAPCSFRTRIGIHIRMLYRVHTQDKRVVVQAIGTREHIYDQNIRDLPPLTPQEVADILAEISDSPKIAVSPPPIQPHQAAPESELILQVPDLPVFTQLLPWITEDELFLLHIPQAQWTDIMNARSVEGLKTLNMDCWTMELIEDYWTAPSPTQVEKLYNLSQGQGIDSIAQQPLSHFLIALDPEQTATLQKIKRNGPYLLKSGTGSVQFLIQVIDLKHYKSHGNKVVSS